MAKKPVFISLDEALHTQMKSVAPLRGTNLQGAYDQAIRQWLSGESGAAETLDIDLHRKLEAILASNNENAIGMARGMIEAAHAIARSGLTDEQIKAFASSTGKQPVGKGGGEGTDAGAKPEEHVRKRVSKSA